MRRLSAPFLYMACIFMLSSIPGDQANPESVWQKSLLLMTPGLQNLLHIPLFLGLALTWIYALNHTKKTPNLRLLTAFILTVIYSFIDEAHQFYTPGRYASLSDIFLDSTGAALIFLIPYFFKPPSHETKQRSLQICYPKKH